VVVRSRRGQAAIQLDGDRVTYVVLGSDPFGYGTRPRVMTRAELLERTAASEYPDAPIQVAQVFDSPRAGDFLVSARRGHDLRTHERVNHRSCHGTLHREHMMVPFAINHPLPPSAVRTPRSVDAFSTILHLLGRPIPAGIDGRTLV
jgi:hypothetical protein